MMDVPVVSAFFLALFYVAFVFRHNFHYARHVWTELWRVAISFLPWFTTRVQPFFNDQTKMVCCLLLWLWGIRAYKHFNNKAEIALGGNLMCSLYAFQLAVGLLFFIPQWMAVRAAPIVNLSAENRICPVGFWIFVSHSLPVIFMYFFGDRGYRDYFGCSHFLRAIEPIFTAATAYALGNIEHHMVL